MRNVERVFLVGILALFLSGCGKSTSASADSAAVASGGNRFDKDAARAEIRRADSAWARAMQAKNVDSLMPYYAPEIVSMSQGAKAAKGTSEVRAAYNEAVKGNMRDVNIMTRGIEFSNDGSMAYAHGSFAVTVDGPNGKPVKATGNYLNVWKNVGGKWMMVAEMGNQSPVD